MKTPILKRQLSRTKFSSINKLSRYERSNKTFKFCAPSTTKFSEITWKQLRTYIVQSGTLHP